MFNGLDLLRDSPQLFRLLERYAKLGASDAEVWQDRLMQMEGLNPKDLVKLHGLLIAFGWVEQNTGHVPTLQAGMVPACYRATALGRRALADVRRGQVDEEGVDRAAA